MNISNLAYLTSIGAFTTAVMRALTDLRADSENIKIIASLISLGATSAAIGYAFQSPIIEIKLSSTESLPSPNTQCLKALETANSLQNYCRKSACELGSVAQKFFALRKTCKNFFPWTYKQIESDITKLKLFPAYNMSKNVEWGIHSDGTAALLREGNNVTGFNISFLDTSLKV